MAHTITIGRNTNPKRTRLGGSHEFGISGRTGPSLRNAQEHTAITVVENVPGSRWNRLNNALPSAFRPGRKHGHTARRRIGGTHRESKHGHETPHAEHKRLRRHSVMLSSQPAWRLFARVLWNKSLPHAAGSERQKTNKKESPERRAQGSPGNKKWVSRGVTPGGNPVRTDKREDPPGTPPRGSTGGSSDERMRRRATLPHPLECSTIAATRP